MISSKGVEASSPINSAALRLELKFMRLSPDPKDMGATIYNISWFTLPRKILYSSLFFSYN